MAVPDYRAANGARTRCPGIAGYGNASSPSGDNILNHENSLRDTGDCSGRVFRRTRAEAAQASGARRSGQLLRRWRNQGLACATASSAGAPPGAAEPVRRRRHHHQPDVRAVSDSGERQSARSCGDGARLLPEQQDLGNHARRPHGLERIFCAQGPPGVSGGSGVARPLRFRSLEIQRRQAGTGAAEPASNVLDASHQAAWAIFRFGPTYGTAFPDEQFPMASVDELYKQMIPDLNGLLPNPNPTWTNMAALAVKLKGRGADRAFGIGFFPGAGALIDPCGVRHRLDRNALRHHADARAACDAGEDSDPRDVRRPSGRRAGRLQHWPGRSRPATRSSSR